MEARRETGARREPVDEARDDERCHVDVEALPQRRRLAPYAAAALTNACTEYGDARADARRGCTNGCDDDTDGEGDERASRPHPPRGPREGNGKKRERGSDS